MPTLLSNYLNVILYLEDMSDIKQSIYKSQCLTIQQFHYKCERSRDMNGKIFGPTVSVLMEFTVRAINADAGKAFYERLINNNPAPYTFIFNAKFNGLRQLSDYEEAMVVHGQVVDIDENYSNELNKTTGTTEQMLINVKLLLNDITYEGNFSNLKLSII